MDFQNGHFTDFEQFKVDIHFANFDIHFGKSKLILLGLFYWPWTGHSYFNEFGQDMQQKIIQKI